MQTIVKKEEKLYNKTRVKKMIEKKDTITRMGKYALAICILHLLGPVWNGRCVFQIDFLELVRTNLLET